MSYEPLESDDDTPSGVAERLSSSDRPGAPGSERFRTSATVAREPPHRRLCGEHLDELSQLLGIAVELDPAGWVREGIALRYVLGPGRCLQPVRVRVARTATVAELLAHGGVVQRCARYNRALDALRILRDRLDAVIRRGHVVLDPDGADVAIVHAHQELARLDDTIARRQAARMGHGVTTLDTLGFEIEFFERYHAHLAPPVVSAEKAEQSSLGDGDTLVLEPGAPIPSERLRSDDLPRSR